MGQGGFTLVELLLAVTMMSLLLALAYGGMRAATRASDSGQAQLEQTGRLRITHQFLRKQFNLMLPLPFMAETESADLDVRRVFSGTPEWVQFVGPMPGYLGSGGLQVQLLAVEPGEDGLALTYRHAVLEDFVQENLFLRDPVILLDGLRSVHFEFLAPAEDSMASPNPANAIEAGTEPGEWVGDWTLSHVLPLVVRMDIDFGEDAKVSWPPLLASPRLDPLAIGGAGADENYGDIIREMIQRRGDAQQ